MKNIDKFFSLVEAVASYFFIFYFIYAIKMPVNIFYASGILLALYYVAVLACPWLRHTEAWKKMYKKK